MTPKQKAYELIRINSLIIITQVGNKLTIDEVKELAQQCALIAVDEIIEVTAPYCDRYEPYYLELKAEMTQQYWQEVKHEIEKL